MNDTISIFRDRADRFSAIVAGADGRWRAPSPCDDWTAGDLVRHVIQTERDFLARQHLPLADQSETDPARAWDLHRTEVLALLTEEVAARSYEGYFGPTTIGDTMANFYGWDLAVHAWDLAASTGQPGPISDAEADDLIAGAQAWGPALYSDGVCHAALPVAADATPVHRLLAMVGRDPSWTAG